MTTIHNLTRKTLAACLKTFTTASDKSGTFYSLPALAKHYPGIQRLPVSIRIVLESVLRHAAQGHAAVSPEQVAELAQWQPKAARTHEIPFTVARVVLQDFTGVPLLADLAAMRSAALRLGLSAAKIEPLVPVDLVVDHSVMVDYFGTKNALDLNMKLEFQRNRERYEFMKWGMQAFDTFKVVPPGFGIVHQVNLEYLARGVHKQKTLTAQGVKGTPLYYPDTLVGTDSHTTMINGIGVVGWGVGGIEAEAAMLGQPVYLLTPDVVGFELTGSLCEGVTATDLVLTITEQLRREKVVGSFVEFFGKGAQTLSVPDRATIANMAPEYGATMGFFPVDEAVLDYFEGTGRKKSEIEALVAYSKAQGLFGVPKAGEIDYSRVITLDLRDITPSLAGPKRPQDRIELGQVAQQFAHLFSQPNAANGFNQSAELLHTRHEVRLPQPYTEGPLPAFARTPEGAPRSVVEMEGSKPTLATAQVGAAAVAHAVAKAAADAPASAASDPATHAASSGLTLGNGDVLIAAITSCTNTSNPSVMLAAGLLAKKAVQAGLKVAPHIKTSLAPGSRIVTQYLQEAGLLPYLEKLGFSLAGYGCTTCIGNAGDLTPELNETITRSDLVCAAVLSGNRNFEARIHPNLKANFLASPPLVVAYAIAGTVLRDLMTQPVGQAKSKSGKLKDVYLGDIWPTSEEIAKLLKFALRGKAYRENYALVASEPGKLWAKIKGTTGDVYTWPASSYIAEPPFFAGFAIEKEANPAQTALAGGANASNSSLGSISGARIMALFGDSITTDHISPAGAIKESTPAGQWLLASGVQKADFNSYGARRGHHEVMMRGTFANVRIKNLMLPADQQGSREEGGLTLYQHDGMQGPQQGEKLSIYDAAMRYIASHTPTVVFAGEEYGTGSSRDWAAKGTALLGIKAVVAQSFERIHRSNLVGMGVLPLQFMPGDSWQSLELTGNEVISVQPHADLLPQSQALLTITRADGSQQQVSVILRIDTPIEVQYYQHGGILPFVLRQLLLA